MDTFSTATEWGLFTGSNEEFTTGLFGPVLTGDSIGKQDFLSSSSEHTFSFLDDSKIGLVSPFLNSGSFGASPLRRAHSSLGLASANATPVTAFQWQHNEPPSSPSSPASDRLQTPRDGQLLPGGFAGAQEAYLKKNAVKVNAAAPINQLTPPDDERPTLRRRYPTAHAVLPSQDTAGMTASAAMPSRTGSTDQLWGSPTRGQASVVAPEPQGQAASPEEVSQFLNDMDELLGPVAPARTQPSPPAPPRRVASVPRPIDTAAALTYNVAGVLLNAEDYALFSSSPSIQAGQWPSTAPAHHTSFTYEDVRPRFSQQQHAYNSRAPPSIQISQPPYQRRGSGMAFQPEYYAGGQSPANLGYEIQRPQSAPASPDLGSNMATFAPYTHLSQYDMPPTPQQMSGAFHRRGGSVETIPRSFPDRMAHHHSSEYPLPQLQRQYETPSPHDRSPPRYPSLGPTYAGRPSYDLQSPSPAPVMTQAHARRGSVAAGAPQQPRTPTRPTAAPRKPSARGKRGKDGGFSFINFTANDSAKLLSGVAPSGSSKRKREEEAAEEERKRARV